MKLRSNIKSFTLVELLIVIAILAILAAAVVIVLNPAELLAQARDSQRITDLKTTKDAIDLFILDNPSTALGTAQRVYISLPDTASNCPNLTGTLPTLPSGWQYVCVTAANLRNTNGTGWIPLDFSSIKGGSPMPFLPVDPTNDLATGRYYTYTMGGSYELTALFEAQKSFAMKDGGSFPEMYEIGSNISLLPVSRDPYLAGYWPFDGTGSVVNGQTAGCADFSGRGNNGTAYNSNGTGMAFTTGKLGNSLQFDGVDDYVNIGNYPVFDLGTTDHSFSLWLKTATPPTDSPGVILIKLTGGAPGAGYDISMSTAGKCAIEERADGGVSLNKATTLSYADNNWHLYVATTDIHSKTGRLYIDGNFVGSSSYTGNLIDSASTLQIGGSIASYSFLGNMDELRIYRRLLSESEIKSLYESGK